MFKKLTIVILNCVYSTGIWNWIGGDDLFRIRGIVCSVLAVNVLEVSNCAVVAAVASCQLPSCPAAVAPTPPRHGLNQTVDEFHLVDHVEVGVEMVLKGGVQFL